MRTLHLQGLALIAVIALAFGVPYLAPYDPAEQLDPASTRYSPPGSSCWVIEMADGRVLAADLQSRHPQHEALQIVRLGLTLEIPIADIINLSDQGVPERRRFLLGTDKFGRDILSRLLYGARVSLGIGFLAAGIGFLLGGTVGSIAGLSGGIIDRLLMRFVDALLAFPRIFLVFTLSALFEGPSWMVIVVLGGTGWMAASRLVRAEVLRVKASPWVEAARASGQSSWRILTRQILPSALDPLVVETTLRVGEVILLEAALSFLGFGVLPPTPSWGQMIADGSDAITYAWWITAFPGAAITLTVIFINLLGDRSTAQVNSPSLSESVSAV